MVAIEKILRSIFSIIDGLVGWAVSALYELIIQIAYVDIFGDYIFEFMGRIYTFLAVFMLFKLSISMVKYILNPEQFTDKAKGFGKLVQNVIIVIALIISVPMIFNWAYELQGLILNTNVLFTIVTGKTNKNTYDITEWNNLTDQEKVDSIKNSANGAADQIKYEIMSTFIYYKDSCSSSNPTDCAKEKSARNNGKSCYEVGSQNGDFDYRAAYDCLMSSDTINNSKEKNFGFVKKGFTNEYKSLISTICLLVTGYVFLVFCFDVALRSVKLGALQLIAPIPIISRLDPASGNNGMFNKWVKECTNTYLSLFIRFVGLFFAVELISAMTSSGRMVWRDTNIPVDFGFVKIFIILGCLMFAKQLPQFIEGITGFKFDTGGLSLKKKLGQIPGSHVAAGAMGFAGGFAANTWVLGRNIKNNGLRTALTGHESGAPLRFNDFTRGAKTIFTGLAGGTSAAYRSFTSKEKNMFKAAGSGISSSAQKRNLNLQRRELDADGIKGAAGRLGTKISNMAGIESGASRFDKLSSKIGELGTAKSDIDTHLEAVDSTVKKYKAIMESFRQKGDIKQADLWKNAMEHAKDVAIRNAGPNDTISALMDNYNRKIKEVNELMEGATYKDGITPVPQLSIASTYKQAKDFEGYAKGYNTSIKSDGIKINGRTWSQEHTKIDSGSKK